MFAEGVSVVEVLEDLINGVSYNGSTTAFGAVGRGSIPCTPVCFSLVYI